MILKSKPRSSNMKDKNLQFILKIAILEGDLFFNYTFPISIATASSKKKEILSKIRNQIKSFFKEEVKKTDKLVDVAIVIYVNEDRWEKQDVDNIAKVVIDSLGKNRLDIEGEMCLLENDSQIVRLFVEKRKSDKITIRKDTCFDSISISVRFFEKHKDKSLNIIEMLSPFGSAIKIANQEYQLREVK
ncbi:hypothetical protein COV12_02220 [Candidatus Woesearchaeota archaeon CG10_big_fil_rev_8_21_14_0_10_32_24]|nr:MAG: hypothetical protein COV12_02220 [Candidatus Woesearchaeota archaeon CG10_big_fil_rev_8_21_14_0_10_32_24]